MYFSVHFKEYVLYTRKWVALCGFAILPEHVLGNTVNAIILPIYMDSVGPLNVSVLFYSICVCSTEGDNEIDRMVYCHGVVTFESSRSSPDGGKAT